MAIALALTSLTGCASSGLTVSASVLPPIPGDITTCINKIVPRPADIRTKQQVAKLIADLKRSEARKTYCGKRLIKLYNDNRKYLSST